MATKAKRKTTKKQAKRVNVGRLSGGLLAKTMQVPDVVPFPEALKEFDGALEKLKDLRVVLEDERDEVTAHRAQVLADLASELSMAAHTLNAAAYAKAEQT